MNTLAIRVDRLSKSYRISHTLARSRYKTLRDDLIAMPRRLWGNLRGQTENQETFWALKDISFEVEQGEVLGIIGRNGAGKSTLLKILSRITEPTKGRAEIYGRVGSLLEVGTGFHPELTGRENIYLSGAVLGMTRKEVERKFDEIVAFAEVERFIDTPAKHYSSGMYVRLAFAVAAHLEPEILLVDEVLAVGDVVFQKKCLGRMGEVAKSGRTVLFVSHNLAAIQQICERGILIHEGHIRQQGPIAPVVQEYIGVAATSGNSVDISPKDHVTGLNGIQVLRAWLVNGTSGSFAVAWKQPIHLALQIQVTKPMPHVSFGLGITTLEGVSVLTVHDTDRGAEPVALEPGYYQVEAWLDNPLRIGTYSLILGAHEAVSKTSIFYIPNAIRLEVLHSTDEGELYFEHNSGIVNGDSTWTVSERMTASPQVLVPSIAG